jgi:hypothetical protein
MTGAFSTKFSTAEELFLVCYNNDKSVESIPWCTFLPQFPSVKALRMEGTNNLRIARALHEDHGGDLLPALEEIQLCTMLFSTPQDQPASGGTVLAAFQPFVSARQQASRPVRVFWGPEIRLSGSFFQ